MSDADRALAAPDLEPRAITIDEYYDYSPEKFELFDGYLFHGKDFPEPRLDLLKLLLVNVGLLEAVKLVPEERWRAALSRVYGDEPDTERGHGQERRG